MLLRAKRVSAIIAVLIATLLVSTIFQPSAAHADPAYAIGMTRMDGQRGEGIGLNATLDCPNVSAAWTVEAILTDSSSNQWTSAIATTSTTGTWQGGVMIVNPNAAIGSATITVRCAGAGLIPAYPYMPVDFAVTTQATDLGFNQAKVGLVTTFSSSPGEGCPSGYNVSVSIFGTTKNSANGLAPLASVGGQSDSNGNWSVQVSLGTNTFTPGVAYYARAECWFETKTYPSLKFTPVARSYVAMGDSFSSGEGAYNYYSTGNDCHRSSDSYPSYLSEANKLSLTDFVACSGAVTDDFYYQNDANTNEDAQLNHLNGSTDVVTLTIGGNDVNFAGIMDACVGRYQHAGYDCRLNSTITSKLASRMSALNGTASGTVYAWDNNTNPIHSVKSVINSIRSAAPNAKIYVAGYPRLFGTSSSHYTSDSNAPGDYRCEVWGGFANVSFADATWLNEVADNLNQVIDNAVTDLQSGNVTYVAPDPFAGHRLCDNSSSYIHDVETSFQPSISTPFVPKNESFHPNTTGMESGYGAAFTGNIN